VKPGVFGRLPGRHPLDPRSVLPSRRGGRRSAPKDLSSGSCVCRDAEADHRYRREQRLALLSATCQYGRSFQMWKLGGKRSRRRPDRILSGSPGFAMDRRRLRRESDDGSGDSLPPARGDACRSRNGRRAHPGGAGGRAARTRRGAEARGAGDPARDRRQAAGSARVRAVARARRDGVLLPLRPRARTADRTFRRAGVLSGRVRPDRRHRLPAAVEARRARLWGSVPVRPASATR
jgi:hypothetical protein